MHTVDKKVITFHVADGLRKFAHEFIIRTKGATILELIKELLWSRAMSTFLPMATASQLRHNTSLREGFNENRGAEDDGESSPSGVP